MIAAAGLVAVVGVAVAAPSTTTANPAPPPAASSASTASVAPPSAPATAPTSERAAAPTPSQPAASAPVPPSPARTRPPAPAPGTALAALDPLPVKGRAPKTGYDRSLFGSGWATTRNGCDTREVVLRRDISAVRLLAGSDSCTVVGGRLADPYTGERQQVTAGNVSTIDIDHVVSLSDAWQKGAQQWDPAKRVRFANDLRNLLATGQSVNAAKGDSDTASWLPPNRSYRCAFVARQVTVKAAYRLAVTAAEKNAMRRVLGQCPEQRTVSSAASRRVQDPHPVIVTPRPEPQPDPKPGTDTPGGATDPRFPTCRAAVAAGYGPYVEGRDPEYAWYRDQDRDGVVCET